MIAATVTLAADARSLRRLIDDGGTQQLGGLFNNRACEIQIQAEDAANFHIVYKSGTVNLATDSGFNCRGITVDTTGASSRIVFRSPTGNQLSLLDIYMAGTGTARIVANTL